MRSMRSLQLQWGQNVLYCGRIAIVYHNIKQWLRLRLRIYYGKMWSIWSKLCLWLCRIDLKSYYILATIEVIDCNLKRWLVAIAIAVTLLYIYLKILFITISDRNLKPFLNHLLYETLTIFQWKIVLLDKDTFLNFNVNAGS
jgi:hypothetical protein